MAAAASVAFGRDQHMLAESGQMMTTDRTAIRRRLAIGRATHRPPWSARKTGHRSIVAPVAAGVAATVAVSLGVAIARVGRERRGMRRREQERRLGLHRNERPAVGVWRMILAQLDLAIGAVEAARGGALDARTIHETRKALKRLRALLRLVRAEIGEPAYVREAAVLRDAGRTLAEARDAEVMLATLDGVIARGRRRLAGRGGVRRARVRLAADCERARAGALAEPHTRAAFLGSLRACRARVETWNLASADDSRTLEPGLRRVYRQGRARHRRAIRRSGKDARRMHEWRKRVKDLRYMAEAIGPPGSHSRLARRADALGEVLGEDHDLAVLDDWIRAQRAKGGKRGRRATAIGRRSAKHLRREIARRRRKLRRRALRDGERLYRARPKKFVRRLRATSKRRSAS